MKFTINIGIAFLCTFLIIACNQSNKSYTKAGEKIVETELSKYKVFKHVDGNYNINIPENWIFKKKKGNAMSAAAPYDKNDSFREKLDVIVVSAAFKQTNNEKKFKKIELDDFANKHFKNLQNKDYQLKIEGRGSKVINGKNSLWASFIDKNNVKDLRIIKYLITDDKNIYIITGTSNFKDFGSFGPIFNEIVESFVVKN